MLVLLMERTGNWYIFPVALARNTVTTVGSVPKLLPVIWRVPFTPWLAEVGLMAVIWGAVADPSV